MTKYNLLAYFNNNEVVIADVKIPYTACINYKLWVLHLFMIKVFVTLYLPYKFNNMKICQLVIIFVIRD